MSGWSFPGSSQTDQARALIPAFALAAAVVAGATDPSPGPDLLLCALAAVPFEPGPVPVRGR